MTGRSRATIHLRVRLDGDTAIGPGKADLLEGIRDTGSIAAAGRRMNMSYKRAWTLVETMNACFKSPLVETARGGSTRGGAQLTETGETVLAAYRRMMRLTDEAVATEIEALRDLIANEDG